MKRQTWHTVGLIVASTLFVLASVGAGIAAADFHEPKDPGSFSVVSTSGEDLEPGYSEADYKTFTVLNDPATDQNHPEFERFRYAALLSPDIDFTCGPSDVKVAGFDRGGTQEGSGTDDALTPHLKGSGTANDGFWAELYGEDDMAGEPVEWAHDDELVTWFSSCYTNPEEEMWTQWSIWIRGVTPNGETKEAIIQSDWIPICEGCDSRQDARQKIGPPPSVEAEAEVEFGDATVRAGAVTVDSVSLSHGGYVAIYDGDPQGDGEIIGVTPELEHGDHSDVNVVLDKQPADGATLYAVPHQETSQAPLKDVPKSITENTPYPKEKMPSSYKTGNGQFDFSGSGDVDAPYTDDGSIVSSVGQAQSGGGDEVLGDVTFSDQESEGQKVVVDEAVLSEGGFVAVYDAAAGPSPDALYGVSGYLEAGGHSEVAVTLDESVEDGQKLVAVSHKDTNDNQEFDYATSDGNADTSYDGASDTAEISVPAPQFEFTVDATAGREPGETFSIEIEVTNGGSLEGSAPVEVTFEDETLIQEEVTIAPGESVSFSESFEVDQAPGTYQWEVLVAGQSQTGEFNVIEPSGSGGDAADTADGSGDSGGDGTPVSGDGAGPGVALTLGVLLSVMALRLRTA